MRGRLDPEEEKRREASEELHDRAELQPEKTVRKPSFKHWVKEVFSMIPLS